MILYLRYSLKLLIYEKTIQVSYILDAHSNDKSSQKNQLILKTFQTDIKTLQQKKLNQTLT